MKKKNTQLVSCTGDEKKKTKVTIAGRFPINWQNVLYGGFGALQHMFPHMSKKLDMEIVVVCSRIKGLLILVSKTLNSTRE